ncbi:MAG: cyclic nucleotide-binding domain-containing protein [Nitrospirota bacterium]|nr:cyclic nucleotide-binding domain-containing protein [Nitrospirota bacterium]MDH5768890.1 cyclic nucleotide-binding domain-containing protein [Nitrospirota bacterium]
MVKTEVLKKQILLEDLDSEGLKKIAGITKKMSLKKGEYLFKEKDDTKGIYLLHTGKVEITRVTPDGWRQTLVVLTPGHFFGELSIFEKRQHVAGAIATEDSEVFLLPKDKFEKLTDEDISLAFNITKKIAIVMSKNVRRMTDKFLSALISY